MNRRGFIRALAGVTAAGAATGLWSLAMEPRHLEITTTVVRHPLVPPAFEGFSMALLADLHHGRYVGIDYIDRAVRTANGLAPDLVLLAGDYVLGSDTYIEPCMRALAGLRGRPLAVLGNHDHWQDPLRTRDLLEELVGARLIENSGVWIERGDSRIRIGGVGDLWEDTQDPIAACEPETGAGRFRILLSHNPDYACEIDHGICHLMLAGHTHGGQVVIPGIGAPILPSRYGQRFRSGLVETERATVYVTRGIGTGFPPIRLNCRPEIAMIRLSAG